MHDKRGTCGKKKWETCKTRLVDDFFKGIPFNFMQRIA